MARDEKTSTRAPGPTYIRRIRVERLFGYLTYTIPEEDRSGVNVDRLMILYGDNGSGKTTLLSLLFCLLSPVRQRGEKTYVAKTPFKRFEVIFDDGTSILATKEGEQLVGSYEVRLNHPDKEEEVFLLKASAEGAIASPAEEGASKLLDRLAKLDIALYFLPDDRRVRTTLNSDTDSAERINALRSGLAWDSDEDLVQITNMPRVQWRSAAEQNRGSHHLDISPVLENINRWFRNHALQGSSAGEETATSIYLRVVEQIMVLAGGAPASDVNYQHVLIERLRNLQSRTDAFSRFGLITPFPAEKFLNAFVRANEAAKRTIATVVEPYVDGIEARLAALDGIRNIILTYVETTNEFLTGKELQFSLQSGVTIQGYRRTPLDPTMLSSGEKQLFLLLSNTILARDSMGIFLIDEPELSLNVKWQRGLINALLRCSQGSSIQYILASHSLELITQHKEHTVRLVQEKEAPDNA
jgi:ABC-type cobalamin/Fe3+-siderophores transport system ATPase subunit